MKRERILVPAMVALAALATACGGDEPPKKDSTVYIDVVDINAKAEAPPPPPRHIGTLRLLGTPVGGQCKIAKFKKQPLTREIWYDSDSPRRSIVVGIGQPDRLFPPLSLEIIGRQGDGTLNEQETLVATFTPAGEVSVGTRSYSASGRAEFSEKEQLNPSDARDAVIFAREMMTLCGDSAR